MRKLSIKAFISSVVSLSAIAAGSLATGAPALAADFTNDNEVPTGPGRNRGVQRQHGPNGAGKSRRKSRTRCDHCDTGRTVDRTAPCEKIGTDTPASFPVAGRWDRRLIPGRGGPWCA
jgi:hypothetical protein